MIQLNLLPEVKLQFIKARRIKRLMMSISFIVSVAAVALLLIMLVVVDVVQKKSLRDVSGDITKYSNQLKSIPDLDKILTVQNQLGTLTGLHDDKAVTSRLFTYISQLTPTQASLTDVTIDLEQNTLSIAGNAPSLDVVSTYTDTLKATQYGDDSNTPKANAFNSVVLASFARVDSKATFTITCNFDAKIFSSKSNVTLTVPPTSTTNQSKLFGTGN